MNSKIFYKTWVYKGSVRIGTRMSSKNRRTPTALTVFGLQQTQHIHEDRWCDDVTGSLTSQ